MTVRTFVVGSSLAALAGGGIWALIITQLDPERAGYLGIGLFFLSLFVAVAGATSLLGYAVRRIIMRSQFPTYAVRTSIRQGMTISLFLTILLALQLGRLYRWWVAIVLVALMVFFELGFLSYDRSHRRRAHETRD